MPKTLPIWVPDEQRMNNAAMTQFMGHLNEAYSLSIQNYQQLHQWSVENTEAFWSLLWDYFDIVGTKGDTICHSGKPKHGDFVTQRDTQWFPEATLNYTENILAHAFQNPSQTALYFENEQGQSRQITWQRLCDKVSLTQQWLRDCNVGEGDVVAGYLPNIPEAIIAMLATSSLGAIWTATSPDFGVESVIERFGQVQPKVLFCADGYSFHGQAFCMNSKNQQVVDNLPTIMQVCQINYLHPDSESPFSEWHHMLEGYRATGMRYHRQGFNAPLAILYSSGTTGKPKCITHSVGGTLLNHLKEHQLHCDIQPNDRVFYYTTCSWMMWNWLVSTLASGASIVVYDGHTTYPNTDTLWQMAERIQVTLFGTSAKYLEVIQKLNYAPNKYHPLKHIKTVCSTGSVLHPHQFDYVYQSISQDVHLASISGGTDICGCFVLGNPISPVFKGEVQGAALGMDVQVFDSTGAPLSEQIGELVCCNSFPNQPIGFWADDGERYHNAYWGKYDHTWHHGDEVMLTDQLGMVFYGRSDTTLNPAGVRIGTADIYQQVNQLPFIRDSLAVGRLHQGDEHVVLFVQLENGYQLNDELEKEIRTCLKLKCSPRHVPSFIHSLSEMPRTKSGKLVELAAKQILAGKAIENIGAIANPEVLDEIAQYA